MPTPGYMWVKDENGVELQSEVTVLGREGSAEILGFQHRIYIPSDEDTGALMGTRKHEPFIITKAFCPLTPVLNKSCASGKSLQEVRLSWYRVNTHGQEEEYFRQMLHDVKVVSVQPVVMDVKDKSKERYGHLERVSMRYEKIQWKYMEGNIVAADSWYERS